MTDVRRRWTRPVLVAVAVIVVLLVAVAVVAVIGGRGAVRSSADVAVGGCVVVNDRGNDAVAVDAVGCTGDGMTFYVAARPTDGAACPAVSDPARLAPDLRVQLGADAICLLPDLRQGRCYLLPTAGDGTSAARRAARYQRKGCSTVAGTADSPIYAVTRRADGATRLDCPAGQSSWGSGRPRPIAYCLTPTRAG
ncbi:MAG: hypothetical protein PGN29_05035 [Gordonia paraffinivorans]